MSVYEPDAQPVCIAVPPDTELGVLFAVGPWSRAVHYTVQAAGRVISEGRFWLRDEHCYYSRTVMRRIPFPRCADTVTVRLTDCQLDGAPQLKKPLVGKQALIDGCIVIWKTCLVSYA
jgi:hypothetical protein